MNHFTLCPRFEQAIHFLSKRWNLLILHQLMSGPKRFCAITEKLGISNKVLTDRLKELEQEGYLTRQVYSETPIRIEYSLTQKGKSLYPMIEAIADWSQQWLEGERDE